MSKNMVLWIASLAGAICLLAAPVPQAFAFGPEPPPPGIDDLVGPAIVGDLTLTEVTSLITTAMVVGNCGGQEVSFTLAFPGLGTGGANAVGKANIEGFTFSVSGANLNSSGLRACYKPDPSVTQLWFQINTVSKVTHPASTVVVAGVVILELIDRNAH